MVNLTVYFICPDPQTIHQYRYNPCIVRGVFSFPFILFIAAFLAVGVTGKTRKNVLLISLASCIAASVLFYVTMMVTMVLAKHGYISAFAGAWSPVIFFTIISIVLLRFART